MKEDCACTCSGQVNAPRMLLVVKRKPRSLPPFRMLQVVKRKPLDFLHVYHHSVVVLMCWNWMQFGQSLQVRPLPSLLSHCQCWNCIQLGQSLQPPPLPPFQVIASVVINCSSLLRQRGNQRVSRGCCEVCLSGVLQRLFEGL